MKGKKMPAISISNPFNKEFLSKSASDQEVHIYLYNRICALEQNMNRLQMIFEKQCIHCQHKRISENIKKILT